VGSNATSKKHWGISVTVSISVSITLSPQALWGPLGVRHASGVSGDATGVAEAEGVWGIAVAPGVSGPLAPASPAGGGEAWSPDGGPVLLVEVAVAVVWVSLSSGQETSKSNKKLHYCQICFDVNPL